MATDLDNRSPEEWLKLLLDYQLALRLQLKWGCQPAEYRKLADLEEAVELVIQRLRWNSSEAIMIRQPKIGRIITG